MAYEIIHVQCPECSPDEAIPHKVLKGKKELLIQCTQCNAVHSNKTLKKINRTIRVIVSTGEQSLSKKITLDQNELISIGDEFIVEGESGDQADFVSITSIESNDKRVDSARADEILTLWARSIDRVVVKISITTGWQTESIEKEVSGERLFTVGEIISSGAFKFRIKGIKIRNGGFVKNEGQTVNAKYIKRVFADSIERIEWLNRPKKTNRKRIHRIQSGGSVIKARGSATWTSKKKEDG